MARALGRTVTNLGNAKSFQSQKNLQKPLSALVFFPLHCSPLPSPSPSPSLHSPILQNSFISHHSLIPLTMRLLAIFTLISLLFAAAVISTYPEPNSCTGVCSNIHDPNVVQNHVDMQYYLFYTGGGIHAAVAPSIGGPWTSLGDVLPNGSSIDHRGNTYLWVRSLLQFPEI